jgi:hypothetical protein
MVSHTSLKSLLMSTHGGTVGSQHGEEAEKERSETLARIVVVDDDEALRERGAAGIASGGL